VYRLQYGHMPCAHKHARGILVDIIIAEHELRMHSQWQERIKRKLESSCTTTGNLKSPNEKLVKEFHSELYKLLPEASELSRKLYEAESMLPANPLKRNYEDNRKDPKWYMRKELVADCAGRNGCCSRGCGCCALRATESYERGVGHCTVECSCCVSFRGFEPSPMERQEIKPWNPE
jgi:hypothetical protein